VHFSVKQAADASGRRICFIGMSLDHYLEAAHKDGRAPFAPSELLPAAELDDHNPNNVRRYLFYFLLGAGCVEYTVGGVVG
jgi:hypothetical protein